LVLLIQKLVHDQRHARGWILNLAHHGDELSDDDSAIDLALHLAEALLEDLDCAIFHRKVTEAPVIAIKQDCSRHLLADHLFDSGDFLAINFDVLNLVDELAFVVVKTNVDPLLSVDRISIFAVLLPNVERGVRAIDLLKLC